MWSKSDFDLSYRSSFLGVSLHYVKATQKSRCIALAETYINKLSITANDRVVVVGCGFGWSIEHLVAKGVNAVGIDASDYINENKHLSDYDEIIGEIILAGQDPEKPTLKNLLDNYTYTPRTTAKIIYGNAKDRSVWDQVEELLQGKPTVIISEDCLSMNSTPDIQKINSHIQRYGALALHLVTCNADIELPNVKNETIGYWRSVSNIHVTPINDFIYGAQHD